MANLLSAIVNLISKIAPLIGAFFYGKKSQENKQNVEIMEDIDEARTIDDRVRTDTEYRNRVRGHFDE